MPERNFFFFWVTFWPLNFHENLSFEIEANLWRVLFQILFILLYKKNIEVHENSSNSSNTALINILMVLWCSPGLSTHFWYITSKMRFFFFLTIRNVGADLKFTPPKNRSLQKGGNFSEKMQILKSQALKNQFFDVRIFFYDIYGCKIGK